MSFRVWTFLALVLAAGTGCFVVYDDPPPRRRVIYREYPAPPPPAVSSDAEEVNDVVYREYFACADDEILLLPHYRRYYGLTDDDIYFLYFVARRSSISFDACFHSYYYDYGRSYDRLVVGYGVPRDRFFVSVGVGVTSYPPVYARTYASYQSGTYGSVTYTNTEYVALVQMRVAVDYQGHPPATYFARVQATGSPSKVIVESRDQCGRGGQTAVGAQVSVKATRAWTLPPDQKRAWHQEHQASVVRAEATFKERHPEQVQKVQAREKAASAKAPGDRSSQGNGAHAKTGANPSDHGPDGHPVEKRPAENHPQSDHPKKGSQGEEREKKGDK